MKALILFLVPDIGIGRCVEQASYLFCFSHTRLRAEDFQATGVALALFSIGIFARSAQNLFARGFYAIHDTIIPAVLGTSVTVLSLPVYWYCARRGDFEGLAAASSSIAIVFACVSFVALVRRTRNHGVRDLLSCLIKISASSVLVALLCYKLTAWLEGHLAWQTTWGAFELLMLVTAVGFPSIFLIARLLGVNEIDTYCRKLVLWSPKQVAVVPE